MKDLLLYIVLKEIFKKKKKGIEINQLSKLLIELDYRNFNITPVIESLNGLSTPHLEYIIHELVIFNILNKGSSYHLTEKGLEYIDEQIKPIHKWEKYKKFLEVTNHLINEHIIKS